MLENLNSSLMFIISQTQANKKILIYILSILWSIYFINLLLHNLLCFFGIIPRRIIGLGGIIFCPFIHANFDHLFFNSIPLLVLSDFILINGLSYFIYVTVCITLLSGLLIWCFAKPGIHIGASAVITGYWALLVSNMFQQKDSVTTIILGVLTLYYFAGIFLGIFPREKGVSWEGHLFGLCAGFVTSYFLSQYITYF